MIVKNKLKTYKFPVLNGKRYLKVESFSDYYSLDNNYSDFCLWSINLVFFRLSLRIKATSYSAAAILHVKSYFGVDAIVENADDFPFCYIDIRTGIQHVFYRVGWLWENRYLLFLGCTPIYDSDGILIPNVYYSNLNSCHIAWIAPYGYMPFGIGSILYDPEWVPLISDCVSQDGRFYKLFCDVHDAYKLTNSERLSYIPYNQRGDCLISDESQSIQCCVDLLKTISTLGV